MVDGAIHSLKLQISKIKNNIEDLEIRAFANNIEILIDAYEILKKAKESCTNKYESEDK